MRNNTKSYEIDKTLFLCSIKNGGTSHMDMEFDLLGVILSETLKFLESGFNGELVLRDETTNSDLPASEMFNEVGGRWFLSQGCLPGDLLVKAVAIDQDGLYLETSPVNDRKTKEIIVDEMLPISYDLGNRKFLDIHTRVVLASYTTPTKPDKDLGERCLWTIPIQEIAGVRRRSVLKLLDLMFSWGGFEVDEGQERISAPISQVQIQKLALGLQQRLAMEQRPILSLTTTVSVIGRTQLSQEFRQLLSLERRIVSMTPDELLEFVVDYASAHGEERTKSILLFALAGNIRRAAPKLSWREARRLARKITVARPA